MRVLTLCLAGILIISVIGMACDIATKGVTGCYNCCQDEYAAGNASISQGLKAELQSIQAAESGCEYGALDVYIGSISSGVSSDTAYQIYSSLVVQCSADATSQSNTAYATAQIAYGANQIQNEYCAEGCSAF